MNDENDDDDDDNDDDDEENDDDDDADDYANPLTCACVGERKKQRSRRRSLLKCLILLTPVSVVLLRLL